MAVVDSEPALAGLAEAKEVVEDGKTDHIVDDKTPTTDTNSLKKPRKRRVTLSQKCGLTLPITRFHRKLSSGTTGEVHKNQSRCRVYREATVLAAATVESALRQLLDKAVQEFDKDNENRKKKLIRRTISPIHVQRAQQDADFVELARRLSQDQLSQDDDEDDSDKDSDSDEPPEGQKKNKESLPSGQWQYFDRGWYDYDADASRLIDVEYAQYLESPSNWDCRSVKSGQFSYLVDFPNMRQTNIVHENHTQRNIRRLAF